MRCLNLKKLYPEVSTREMWVIVFSVITSLNAILLLKSLKSWYHLSPLIKKGLVSWNFEILGTQQLSSLKKDAKKVSFTDCHLDQL